MPRGQGPVLWLVQSGEQVQVRLPPSLPPSLLHNYFMRRIFPHDEFVPFNTRGGAVGGHVLILSKLVWNPFLTRIVSTPDSLNISFNFL